MSFFFSSLFCILLRQHPKHFFKTLREITGRAESYPIRYFDDRQSASLQEVRRPLQTTNAAGVRLGKSG